MNHPTIKLNPVKSSNVAEVGHEGSTLAVKYLSGGSYHYHGVTAQQYESLLKAKSIGAVMGAIKAKHKCTVVK